MPFILPVEIRRHEEGQEREEDEDYRHDERDCEIPVFDLRLEHRNHGPREPDRGHLGRETLIRAPIRRVKLQLRRRREQEARRRVARRLFLEEVAASNQVDRSRLPCHGANSHEATNRADKHQEGPNEDDGHPSVLP